MRGREVITRSAHNREIDGFDSHPAQPLHFYFHLWNHISDLTIQVAVHFSQRNTQKVDLILITYNFVKTMLPLKNNLFLIPKKKSVTSLSGIILEEDKGEMDPNIYTVLMAWPEADQSLVGLEVISSDHAGINCVVQGQHIKVVTPELILGTL